VSEFDPALASIAWDKSHRPVDLDPPPRQPRPLTRATNPAYRRDPADLAPVVPTDDQRWRLERNSIIYIAARNGASERKLARVFKLSQANIHKIIGELNERFGDE
jgi:hypothetical protein